MLEELDLEQAKQKLIEHGGYNWLLEGDEFWSVAEVVHALAGAGMQVNKDYVTSWFRDLPHTQDFRGRVGMRASKNDLILFFASQMGKVNVRRRHRPE
jgi:hypothetical protein